MAAALAYRPDHSQAILVCQIKPGAYNTASLIDFLVDLHEHLHDQKIIPVWDGLPAHRSQRRTTWTRGYWLTVEQLPGYAYDLNPVEQVWGNIKALELVNLCPDTLEQAYTAAHSDLERVGTSYDLCYSFLDHCGLPLYQHSPNCRKMINFRDIQFARSD